MEERRFDSAHEMMEAALGAASEGALVLTPTSRLAKRYRHARRMVAVEAGIAEAWETPEILGAARWIRSQYDALWDPRALLPRGGQLRFWSEAFAAVALPEEFTQGLQPTPALFSKLQQTYDLLCRKRAGHSGPEGESLSRWRGAVIRKYEALLRINGYRAWDEVVRTVACAAEDGKLPCPRSIVTITLEGASAPEPLEQEFVGALERGGAKVSRWSLSRDGAPPKCKVYATPEQECRAVCHEARLAWNASEGRRYLGIVAMDETHFPLLQKALEDLSGRALPPGGQARFNFAWGAPLTGHPLFQIAVLPLRLATAEAPAALLSSLLCSPFTRLSRHGCTPAKLREALWPEETLDIESALARLARISRSALDLVEKLQPFTKEDPRPLGMWVKALRAVWDALGLVFFGSGVSEPVRDAQANSWEGLERAIHELEHLAGDLSMEPGEVLAWLQTTCESRQVVIPGGESGGLQVLGLREAFGIPFDRLWVVGCHGGILPAPRPAEPLLVPEEKLRLGKKAHEEAWDLAVRDLAVLRSLCSEPEGVTFSRAFTGAGDQPFLSSPLLSDWMDERRTGVSAKVEKVPFLFDIWKGEKGNWLAARWLAATERGLKHPGASVHLEPQAVPDAVPNELSVSGLRSLLGCPFRYFAGDALRLEPLPSPPDGLSPVERGELVHEILKEFVGTAPDRIAGWPGGKAEAWDYLKRLAEERLGGKPKTAEWRAERRWLLGEGRQVDTERPGVLQAWLEAEIAHWRAGWKPVEGALEVPFKGLTLGASPITLRGRMDRVDEHPEQGRWVMDYKTGVLPAKGGVYKKLLEPQLPAYCAAVLQGHLGDTPSEPWDGPVTAGFIPLQKAAEVEIVPFSYGKEKIAISRDWVEAWMQEMEARLAPIHMGLFPAEPRPLSGVATTEKEPCIYCGLQALCGFYDGAPSEIGDPEEGGEA